MKLLITFSELVYLELKNVIRVMISHKLGDLLDEFPPIRLVSTKTWVRLAVLAHAEVTSLDRMRIPAAVRKRKLSGLRTRGLDNWDFS